MASQFGPYKLIRQVAVGGMAEIHLAKTAGIAGFEKYVAIKMIHPNFAEDEQFIQMLVDEAKIAVQLNHGNIAQTFDLGRVGETYYITMEYVDGADLYKILRRASEQDLEMPLDVCAFVAKEISSALDHAHRKRDHAGKSLGIVHRDVSPQNVLVSYAGEVKLVDFGIAKATMKARQTAVGVIKGKYYYMSPEQAWGDPIDHRSDIFSAGIVLYEMITGQMLYLEEDLHKLLEMARAADIAPPSKLRKGVPPQLERIVMHALAKLPGDRYQTAGDFATDLERFLHAYSPVFTASKLSNLMRQVIGEPMEVPDEVPFEAIEFRDGVMSTHPLDDSEIAHAVDREELRDENSVIFRMSQLDKQHASAGAPPPVARPAMAPPPAPPTRTPPVGSAIPPRSSARPTEPSKPAPKTTRAADSIPVIAPRAAPASSSGPTKIPSIAPRPTGGMKIPQITKPRQAHEETRQLEGPAPANPLQEDSGLLIPPGPPAPLGRPALPGLLAPDLDDDLENIGERTVVTAAPGASGSTAGSGLLGNFMMDVVTDDSDGPVEATLVTSVPGFGGAPALSARDDDDADAIDSALDDDLADEVDDDMPTLSGREGIQAARELARDLSRDAVASQQRAAPPPAAAPAVRRSNKAPPPAALAAKIHAPAVSELRKPRASRRTPPGGSPVTSPNVLQAIVSSQGSAPMPSPRPQPQPQAQPLPPAPLPPAPPTPQPMAAQQQTYVQQPPQQQQPPPQQTPQQQHDAYVAHYATDASGMPLGLPQQQQMMPGQGYPGQQGQLPAHLTGQQPYLMQPGMPPGGYDPQTAIANQVNAYGYPQLSPQALYQFQPSQQKPMSLTGQLRLSEIDEMPSQYKIGSAGRRWFTYAVSGLIAISVAAASTFLIIRSTRDAAPTTGTIHIDSTPQAAVVTIDGSKMTQTTPVTIDEIPVGTRHMIRIEAAHYQPYEETIDIPKKGGEVTVIGRLQAVLGKILVDSRPTGAEIWINGTLRGHSSTSLTGFDLGGRVHVELRLKDYQPVVKDYDWPSDGKITISETLVKVK